MKKEFETKTIEYDFQEWSVAVEDGWQLKEQRMEKVNKGWLRGEEFVNLRTYTREITPTNTKTEFLLTLPKWKVDKIKKLKPSNQLWELHGCGVKGGLK